MKTRDSNDMVVTMSIRHEPDGTWGRNVWFGRRNVTDVRRYYYRTRVAARAGDISDDIGQSGRVR